MSLSLKFLNKSRKTEFFTIKKKKIEATSTLKNIDPEEWTLLGDICSRIQNFLQCISSTSMVTEAGDS